MVYTLVRGTTTITLHSVQSERVSRQTFITVNPMPTGDAGDAMIIDYGGVVEQIVIDGKEVFNDPNKTEQQNWDALVMFVKGLSELANGNQTGGDTLYYNSDLLGTNAPCVVLDLNITYNAGIPMEVDYSITLVRGSLY